MRVINRARLALAFLELIGGKKGRVVETGHGRLEPVIEDKKEDKKKKGRRLLSDGVGIRFLLRSQLPSSDL